MSEEVTVKIDRKLANKVREIAIKKYELRKIKFYSEGVIEALIEFVKENKDFLNDPNLQIESNQNQKLETPT
jgi:hypothetical protein